MRRTRFASWLLTVALAGCAPTDRSGVAASLSRNEGPALRPVLGRKMAAGFDGVTAWLNVDRPLTRTDLDGKIVVVDFWTSCCINCLHTLPILARLEKRFVGEPVVFIGVHSPKFSAEKEAERLRSAISENAIEHAIAVDGSMNVWNRWHVASWPTVAVLDAHGRIAWAGVGEPDERDLVAVVTSALAEGQREGALNRSRLAALNPMPFGTAALSAPGKVIALTGGGFAISDTAHNRVVVTKPDGALDFVVGSGLAGKTDGAFAEASFDHPHGLAELGSTIFVADTDNHALRAIDRVASTVRTVAGTGSLGRGPLSASPLPATTTSLRSPWDLVATGRKIYVALAGSHQIGVFDPAAGSIAAFAGDGDERRVDGTGSRASFAQPSGLATDGGRLFVVDAETSSVRVVDLRTARVETLVGEDLFVFGDVDGSADQVRLQHPVGIAWDAGMLYVADTYNSKIKLVDPTSGTTRTLPVPGLAEPSGLAVRGKELIIADTHHDRVVRAPTDPSVADPTELDIAGLIAPPRGVAIAPVVLRRPPDRFAEARVAVPGAAAKTTLHFAWQTPRGTGVNADGPFRVHWVAAEGLREVPPDLHALGRDVARGFDVGVELRAGARTARLDGDVDLVVCDDVTHAVCVPVRRQLVVAIDAGASGPSAAVPLSLPSAHR